MPVPGTAFLFWGSFIYCLFMNIFIDESGDLGFTFTRPFRKGGSSRFLTISFLLVPQNLSPLTKRIVRAIYKRKKQSTAVELKGSELSNEDKLYFSNKVVTLLKRNPRIKIFAITVDKRRVKAHIREDPNKLYNYMISLVLPEKIRRYSEVNFIPDKNSI